MCEHKSILQISGKTSDMCFARYTVNGSTEVEGNGYVPDIDGLFSGSDYIEFELCVDCGVITTMTFPLMDEQIRDAIEGM